MHLFLQHCILAAGIHASLVLGFLVPQSGLAGITFNPYSPLCAHACYRIFCALRLSCYSATDMAGYNPPSTTLETVPYCRASNVPYLSSIAWCIHTRCPADTPAALIEQFWQGEITGDPNVLPKWSYALVLRNITQAPTQVQNGTTLNSTQITTDAKYWGPYWPVFWYQREQARESVFGMALLMITFALPLLLAWLAYLPFMSRLRERAMPWLLPSVFSGYHDRALPYLLGNLPTVGQALYIFIIAVLNVIFTTVGYEVALPYTENKWFTGRHQEFMNRVFNRTGVLAFCLMPVMLLFSSRNNLLLWLTTWSHSTYLLMHRWIARLFVIQVILHSAVGLALYISLGSFAVEQAKPYWIWGIVATLVAVIILFSSILYIRRRSYEVFLAIHIVLSVFCLVGCWYHVILPFGLRAGYETWLYATFAVWGFDRIVRVGRILKVGTRRASITELGADIVRVDIPGIRWEDTPGSHAYVYFPSLHPLRPWENHPFSIISTAVLSRHTCESSRSESGDTEKVLDAPVMVQARAREYTSSGISLLIRKSTGMTSSLGPKTDGLMTLVEGPYPNNPHTMVLGTDRLLLVGGGIGITGLLPFLHRHANAKLYFTARAADACLVDMLGQCLDDGQEKDVKLGARLDIHTLLEVEIAQGWTKIGVVVCGPPGMCDDTRTAVARLGQHHRAVGFELEIDSFIS